MKSLGRFWFSNSLSPFPPFAIKMRRQSGACSWRSLRAADQIWRERWKFTRAKSRAPGQPPPATRGGRSTPEPTPPPPPRRCFVCLSARAVMAAVDIFDVRVLDNPAPFTNPLQFEITYDVREALKEGSLPWHCVDVRGGGFGLDHRLASSRPPTPARAILAVPQSAPGRGRLLCTTVS
jgi:hypothetical protein